MTCGTGKLAQMGDEGLIEVPESAEMSAFVAQHKGHRLEIVPEVIFLSDYVERGFEDTERPGLKAVKTRMEGSTAGSFEKEMPFGAPETTKDAFQRSKEASRALNTTTKTVTASEPAQGQENNQVIHVPAKTAQLRPTWDQTFLEVAQVLAQRGTCSRLKVGAVLVNHTRIISTGYNGAPAGLRHCDHTNDGDMEDGHCSRAEHGERNSLLLARTDARGATMYLTAAPCLPCARMMTTVGVKRIVYGADYRPDKRVDELCTSAGIELVSVKIGA